MSSRAGVVGDLGGAAEREDAPGAFVDVDHDGIAAPLAQALDLRLEMSLILLGDVVLGVLLEIAHLAGDLDPLSHLEPTAILEVLDLRFEVRHTLSGDRFTVLFVHRHAHTLAGQAPIAFFAHPFQPGA